MENKTKKTTKKNTHKIKIDWHSSLYLSLFRSIAGLIIFILLSVMKIFELHQIYPYAFVITFIIFLIASTTDFLDGRINNKYNQSKTQIIFEQLADKILIYPIVLFFIKFNLIFTSVIIVLFIRDLIALTGKLILFEKEIEYVVPRITKIKTFIEILAIMLVLLISSILGFNGYNIEHIEWWKITVSVVFSIIDLLAIYTLFKYYKPIWKYIVTELKHHEIVLKTAKNTNSKHTVNKNLKVIDDHKELHQELFSEKIKDSDKDSK